jgi:hypothetical protein
MPGKDHLLQHSCVSPVNTVRHDPEVWCDFPSGGEGSKNVQGSDRVSQNTHRQGIFKSFSPLPRGLLECSTVEVGRS